MDLLYLTDSHLGKTSHSFKGESWPVSPEPGFRAAINCAIEENVTAVVHGGDLFHNDGNGIAEKDVGVCRESLIRLAEDGIPFYFVHGNHESQAGRRIMQRFADDGPAVHLGSRYEVIGDALAIYGIDHRYGWSDFVFDFEAPSRELATMLCVHQSVAPFTASSKPDCSLSELRETSNIPLDLIVTGHTHTRSERLLGECRGLSGGATTRVGESKNDLRPSGELVSVEGGDVSVQRQIL